MSTRVDLTPERHFVVDVWDEIYWYLDGVPRRVKAALVPAAGHLGVQEVVCPDEVFHEGVTEAGFRCSGCGAQV